MSDFLCSKTECEKYVSAAKQEAKKILNEMSIFFTGDIDIEVRSKQYVMGFAPIGVLLVGSEIVREYSHIDLLFLDLNELMLKKLCQARATEQEEPPCKR